MNVCIPVNDVRGLESPVCAHFGSAPAFLIVDTDTRGFEPVENLNLHHGHGACNPLSALSGKAVDAVIVGGIGAGAVSRLRGAGLKVYQAQGGTVSETIEYFLAGRLVELDESTACAQHRCNGQGHGA